MAARTMWKGQLVLRDERVPVRLYAAVEDRSVHFNLLHDRDQQRLRRRLIHPETGELVDRQEALKGLEVSRGRYVVLEQEELQELVPEASRDIDVICFVDPRQVNHQWYQRPYYLGPDGDDESYFALATALAESEKEGLVRWTMRGKRYLGGLRSREGYLVLVTLRSAPEVIDAGELPSPRGRELAPREREMAAQLVAALEEDFKPEKYHDEYRERVLELIESKRQGKKPPEKQAPRKPRAGSLEEALSASLKGAKG